MRVNNLLKAVDGDLWLLAGYQCDECGNLMVNWVDGSLEDDIRDSVGSAVAKNCHRDGGFRSYVVEQARTFDFCPGCSGVTGSREEVMS